MLTALGFCVFVVGFFFFLSFLATVADILRDFDVDDISDALEQMHTLFWSQQPASPSASASASGSGGDGANLAATKTLALTVPQWGDSEAWRPSRRPTSLTASEASEARGHVNGRLASLCRGRPDQCSLVDLDQWFPRHTLVARELARKWADEVHPTPEGYDELGLIVYQHIRHLL